MTGQRFFGLALFGITALLAALPPAASADEKTPPDTIRIGLVTSLFRDVPAPLIELAKQPFRTLMRDQTGLNGEMAVGGDPMTLAKLLQQDKLHLGVFHGVEFAWAQERYPELRPLVIAINRQRVLHANLVVREDSTATTFADFKDKKISLPRRSREHCHLFLQRLCTEAGCDAAAIAAQTVGHVNVEDALDDVLRGKVQAAIVDSVSLESYELVKPGCHARLKVFKQSEAFPAAVIVYHQGALDAATLKCFREGMMNANATAKGRDLMAMWKLTGFEEIPGDFQKNLESIRLAYPNPETASTRAPAPSVTPPPSKKN